MKVQVLPSRPDDAWIRPPGSVCLASHCCKLVRGRFGRHGEATHEGSTPAFPTHCGRARTRPRPRSPRARSVERRRPLHRLSAAGPSSSGGTDRRSGSSGGARGGRPCAVPLDTREGTCAPAETESPPGGGSITSVGAEGDESEKLDRSLAIDRNPRATSWAQDGFQTRPGGVRFLGCLPGRSSSVDECSVGERNTTVLMCSVERRPQSVRESVCFVTRGPGFDSRLRLRSTDVVEPRRCDGTPA